MSKKTKLIPELRFPEFVDEGEWEEKILGKLAKKIVKKNKDGLINNVFTNSAIDGIVDQREYFDKDIANKNNLENYYIVEDGDYVYNPRISNIAPVGPISKNKTKKRGVLSPLYTVFRFTNKNNDFYEYYFKTIHWYSAIRKASNTGARFDRMSITDSVFMNIPILYPLPSEQQKIASCLSSLDEMIAAQGQKLDLLKDHKKGLMQKLFPQEGEKVPKYRFKEFEKDGEWVEMTINQVFGSFSGGTPNTSKKEYYGGGIPFIRSAEIDKEETELSLTKEGLKNSSAKLVNKGDLLVALYGANSGETAISKIDGAINQAILCLQSEYSNAFTYNFLTLRKNWIVSKFIQGGQGNLSGNIIKSISIPFPSPKEQQKIASCLSSLDALITAQTEKIEQLKLHKKGLMQGLFPKIND